MRPRKLTAEKLAFAYELRQEYGFKYEYLAALLKVDRSVLNLAILRCEREGLGWVKANQTRARK